MKTLFLDLASHSGLLACVADDRVAASQAVDHRIDDSELLPHVEAVIKNAGWSYPDLTQIACVTGPGGFTSLRVAVALANALSNELKIPVCGIHLSDVYEKRMTLSSAPLPVRPGGPPSPAGRGFPRSIVWLHSTKKTELFIRGEQFSEPTCIKLEELPAQLKKGMHWMGELIPEHRAVVDAAGLTEAPLKPLADILPDFLMSLSFDHHLLQPWYGRGW